MKRAQTAILAVLLLITAGVTAFSFMNLSYGPGPAEYDPVEFKAGLLYQRAGDALREGLLETAESAYVRVVGSFPSSSVSGKALNALAEINISRGDLGKAVYYYERLLKASPDTPGAEAIRSSVAELNMRLMQSSIDTVDSIEYTVQRGDTLYGIARKFNTTVELIRDMNDLSTDLIMVGQKLKINISKFSIKVDKAANILYLEKDDEVFKAYKVATGKDNSTPTGVFTVTEKAVKPVWTKPGLGMIEYGHPEYELGARWIAISEKGYGIHGTNDESTIGSQVTAGCVRMYNDDVIELYNIIPVGTEVTIIDSAGDPDTEG